MWYIICGLIVVAAALFFLPVTGRKREKIFISFPEDKGKISLPKKFLWGTATAAQQIESQTPTDWTAFEKRVVKEKKFDSLGRGKAKPGHIHNLGNYPAEVLRKKTDYDRLFAKDLSLAAKYSHNSYRFSIEWARLFPKEGMSKPDKKGIEYYRNILKACKHNKLKPSVTLFHFSSPQWFWQERNGYKGWERDDAIELFSHFVQAVAHEFGGDIDHWCTLNEPMVYIYNGYLEGIFPPNELRRDPVKAAPLAVRMLEAHVAAWQILKQDAAARNKKIEVGFTQHTRRFEPLRNWHGLDRLTARMVEQAFMWDFCDAFKTGVFRMSGSRFKQTIPGLKDSLDYLGINYYGRFYLKTNVLRPMKFEVLMNDPASDELRNDLDWAIYPHGFYLVLTEAARRYGLPIYVLENGTADAADDDRLRQRFLVEHIREMALAIRDGADVRGYWFWSLVDNFEWAEGFEARFGLVKVDYLKKFQRIPRPSLELFKEIIEENGVSQAMFEYCRNDKRL